MEIPYLRKLNVHVDERGESVRLFEDKDLKGMNSDLFYCLSVLNNHPGTIRGMHISPDPFSGGKVLTVTSGAIFDISIDLRPESPFFRQGFKCTLKEDDRAVLKIPPGFMHGYQTLVEKSSLLYGLDEQFLMERETGYSPLSNCLRGSWPLDYDTRLSKKDSAWPNMPQETLILHEVSFRESSS